MTASEFISFPFPAFRHEQLVGDLLIIPPRWYAPDPNVFHYPEDVTVLHRISAKDRLPLSHGHACQFMV
jgi:hypothetical protein